MAHRTLPVFDRLEAHPLRTPPPWDWGSRFRLIGAAGIDHGVT